ncbi:putative Ubiquitin-like domain-containing protein [Helianthus annuus]|nr:putative Ubiquitin-like domain-containing protein [Helianthus annuus]KAJ0793685.1 putative Ubiquitin-like domain-containing protein [Helianthus annuus]KAJ0958268.1 putative Ubiquitin domain-containing protein [Helianthus annuus]
MADEGKGMADEDDRSGNRKRKYVSDFEFIVDDVEVLRPQLVRSYLLTSEAHTVGSVKVKIQAEERIPFDNQELIFNEMVLENINTFTNLSIKKGSTLTLRVKAVDRLKIFLITFSGKTITLLLKPTCTITELKTMIEFMEDIPCEEQALIFNETVLGDNGTLFDYRINKNETLKLMRLSTGIMEIDILIFYSGETITLKVKPSDTIYSIKAMIRDETQKPIDEQAGADLG